MIQTRAPADLTNWLNGSLESNMLTLNARVTIT